MRAEKREFVCKDKAVDVKLLAPVIAAHKDKKGSLITVLQKAQELYGYLPTDLIYHIALEMRLKPSKVMGVVTFYAQFRTKPVGKYLITLCQGTACHVNGSKEIERAVMEEMGGDSLFTLENVACLGCCSLSPVMMINDETYGSLTKKSVKEIMRGIREREGGDA
ncbi:MAG: NAD(P)H-dependent oxidoreductase subunit E [Clostridiales bacterium]|jgi:NADH-quinone oxidoreductase subunit E|nr:NAD(P)H-dependent oxidoreductase subunit E [Clostridiales bacterium]